MTLTDSTTKPSKAHVALSWAKATVRGCVTRRPKAAPASKRHHLNINREADGAASYALERAYNALWRRGDCQERFDERRGRKNSRCVEEGKKDVTEYHAQIEKVVGGMDLTDADRKKRVEKAIDALVRNAPLTPELSGTRVYAGPESSASRSRSVLGLSGATLVDSG